MEDDSRVVDTGWDALPEYGKSGDADDAVTVSISTTPGEWLVNTVDSVVLPMSMAEVVEALRSGKLTERSLVWRSGMQEWSPVDKVPQLKLAARLQPSPAPSQAPPRPTPAAGTLSKAPPKPARSTPAPPPAAPAPATTTAAPPAASTSRRSTLPSGTPAPVSSPSRPSNPRVSAPRPAIAPAASQEEPEVLAVYARPAATTSFDLSPVLPPRTATPVTLKAPHTLAPTTTDSAQRRAPTPVNADLSVVAARDFREIQRSSKRLVWTSSLASAAAASLLTFAVSRSRAPSAPAAAPLTEAAAAMPAPSVLPAAPPAPAALPSAAPSTKPEAEAPPSSPSVSAPVAKPKARRAKAVSAAPARAAAPAKRPEADKPGSTTDPSSEPNPYDVKLDETPAAKTTSVPAPVSTHGSRLEADSKVSATPENASDTPGF